MNSFSNFSGPFCRTIAAHNDSHCAKSREQSIVQKVGNRALCKKSGTLKSRAGMQWRGNATSAFEHGQTSGKVGDKCLWGRSTKWKNVLWHVFTIIQLKTQSHRSREKSSLEASIFDCNQCEFSILASAPAMDHARDRKAVVHKQKTRKWEATDDGSSNSNSPVPGWSKRRHFTFLTSLHSWLLHQPIFHLRHRVALRQNTNTNTIKMSTKCLTSKFSTFWVLQPVTSMLHLTHCTLSAFHTSLYTHGECTNVLIHFAILIPMRTAQPPRGFFNQSDE